MSAETTCCFTFSSESKTWWTILQDSCPGVHKCRLPLPISQKQEEQSFIAVFSFVVFVYPFHILGKLCNFWMAWKCLYFCSIFEVPPLGHICLLWPCTLELCKMDTILLDRIQLLVNNYLYNTSELFPPGWLKPACILNSCQDSNSRLEVYSVHDFSWLKTSYPVTIRKACCFNDFHFFTIMCILLITNCGFL